MPRDVAERCFEPLFVLIAAKLTRRCDKSRHLFWLTRGRSFSLSSVFAFKIKTTLFSNLSTSSSPGSEGIRASN